MCLFSLADRLSRPKYYCRTRQPIEGTKLGRLRTSLQVVGVAILTIKMTDLMTVGDRKARRQGGEEEEQLSKSSDSPTDTALARVFHSGWVRGCKQVIRFRINVHPELL